MLLPSRAGFRRVVSLLTLASGGWAAAEAVGAEPALESLPSGTVAYLQRTGDRADVPASIGELLAWARTEGVEADGPPTAIFYSDPAGTPPEMLFWEVRLPIAVSGSLEPRRAGEIRVLRTEAVVRAACIVRRGRPGDGGPDLVAFRDWMKRRGLEINGPRIETYLDDLAEDGAVRLRLCFPVIQR